MNIAVSLSLSSSSAHTHTHTTQWKKKKKKKKKKKFDGRRRVRVTAVCVVYDTRNRWPTERSIAFFFSRTKMDSVGQKATHSPTSLSWSMLPFSTFLLFSLSPINLFALHWLLLLLRDQLPWIINNNRNNNDITFTTTCAQYITGHCYAHCPLVQFSLVQSLFTFSYIDSRKRPFGYQR